MKFRMLLIGFAIATLTLACSTKEKSNEDTESASDADTDADTAVDTQSDSTADTSSDSTTDTSSDTVADTNSDTDADTSSDTDADTSSDTDADTSSDTVADTSSDTVADTSSDTVADTSSDTVADTGSDTVADTNSDTVADTNSDTTSDTGSVSCTLSERLHVSDVTAPAGVKPGVSNWRVWGASSLSVSPVFTVPHGDGGTIVGYTTGTGASPVARVSRLNHLDELVESVTVGTGYELRGLAIEPDDHFAALLWDDANNRIYLRRFSPAGIADWTTELINTGAQPTDNNTPTDFNIGESRLEFGDGKYGAYYHVHSNSGHEGDTLKWVTTAGAESTGWTWGCSHSMSNLLRYNGTTNAFLPVCVTDCYPGTTGVLATTSIGGVYLNRSTKVRDVDGACNAKVAGELGGAAISPTGFKLVYNTHQNATTLGQSSYSTSTMNQDIAWNSITGTSTVGAVVWLTGTPSVNEADASVARWQPEGDSTEQYIVGWSQAGSGHRIARVDAAGSFLDGPIDISATAKWGKRDDPFRTSSNGDVIWAWFDSSGDTTLHFARLSASCNQ